MRRFLVLLLSVIALLQAPAGHAAAQRPVVLVLGDSLSAGYRIPLDQGWVARLQHRLESEGYGYDVVNASVSGETTDGALLRLPRILDLHQPAIVIIELGGNDGLRGLPLEDMRDNLQAIATLCRTAGAQVVLTGIRMPPNYGPRYTEAFYSVYHDLAARLQLAWVPHFLAGVALREDLFQDDGIHPDLQAQPMLLDNVWPVLQPLLQH